MVMYPLNSYVLTPKLFKIPLTFICFSERIKVSNNHHILSQPLLGVIEFMSIYSFKKSS
jgi:hypothetical protein